MPKKAITAGPGNPPAVVDQTADIDQAARDIVRGASFDNNIICTDEKTTIVVDSVADRLVQAMAASTAPTGSRSTSCAAGAGDLQGAGPAEQAGGHQPAWIGQDAGRILAEIGVSTDDTTSAWSSPRCRTSTAWFGPSR